jgi:transcription initiation factor TFIIIB Brf1 subunit/transcription initiation factor TFIIB
MELIWAQLDTLRAQNEPKLRFEHECICRNCGHDQKICNEDLIPTCTNCGAVDVEFVSDEPEWRSGLDDDGNVNDPSRVGMPADTVLFSEAWGTGTKMEVGKFASSALKKMAKINFHTSMNHKDRSLFHAYEDLERIGKNILDLPSTIVREAKILYRKFNGEKLTRGAVRVGIKANCIIWACKQANVPRTTKEIADAFGIPTRDISRTEDLFREVVEDDNNTNNGQITFPSDILGRFFNTLTVVPDGEKGRVKMKMISMCKTIQKSAKLMGKTPKGTASAVMFVILNELGYKVDKQTICALCEVSLPTLNKLEPIVRTEMKKIVV